MALIRPVGLVQLLVDLDYNVDGMEGVEPEHTAYKNEEGLLADLRLIDVRAPGLEGALIMARLLASTRLAQQVIQGSEACLSKVLWKPVQRE